MKAIISLKKALLIGAAILALGTNTVFAETINSSVNNKNTNNSSNQKELQQESNFLNLNNNITPIQTLAKLLDDYPQTIEKDLNKNFLTVYQYAEKKGILNKYKAERITLAKDNIQNAVATKKLTKKEGTTALIKIQYNIIHEKPETMSVSYKKAPQDSGVNDLASENRAHSQNSNKGQHINKNIDAPNMIKKLNKEAEIEKHLKTAISNNEFFLVYQPHVDIKTGKTIGMEALLRWNSQELGNVPPMVFIPIAEKSNLIVEIGDWVTNQVCKDLETMNQNNPKEIKNLRCSINVSPLQLANDNFVENLLSIISKYNINYNQLELEITESLLLDDLQKSKNMLGQINKLGIKIALDDFGIGYSSFSYLLALPIDQIKIDRSFIKDYPKKDDGTLIKILVDMSKKLNKTAITEGAETIEQVNFLRDIGCNYIQGYYYSKPLLKEDFIKFVQETNK